MNVSIAPAPVRKSVLVEAPVERAFAAFARIGEWWIRTHTLSASGQRDVILEPRAGGRWYEIGKDGETCEWGKVVEWQPPRRMLLRWQIGADWKSDPSIDTEVEIRFTPEGKSRTRVDLEHRKLEAYGAAANDMAAQFGSDGGWQGLLAAYAGAAKAG
jgi:uncharacterized protein YndB with AHSA1/START domain